MFLTLLYLGSIFVTGYLANKKGRNVLLWVILAIFFSTVIAIIMICLGSTEEKKQELKNAKLKKDLEIELLTKQIAALN